MTEQQPGEVRYLFAMFTGDLPDGNEAGYGISAGTGMPPEALEEMRRMAVRGLEMQYPGVKNIRCERGWEEHVLYLDDDTDETTEDA